MLDLIGLMAAIAPAIRAQAAPRATDASEVRTVATAERRVRPDFATVTLRFNAERESPRAAGAAVAAQADSLRRALGALGIPRDSLVSSTDWYSWRGRIETVVKPLRYVRINSPDGRTQQPVQDTAYRAFDAIQVRIHDLRRIGAVIDAALALRIPEISPVQFGASDITSVQDALLSEATKRARRQAEVIAGASGSQLGRIRYLSTQPDETSRYDELIPVAKGASVDSAEESPTTVVQPGIPVSATVYARWELVPKP